MFFLTFGLQQAELQRDLTTLAHRFHTYTKSQQKYFKLLSLQIRSKLQKPKTMVQKEELKYKEIRRHKISQIITSHHFKAKDESILPKGNLVVGYKHMLDFYLASQDGVNKKPFYSILSFKYSFIISFFYKVLKENVHNILILTLRQKAKADTLQTSRTKSYLPKHRQQIKQQFIQKQKVYKSCVQKLASIIKQTKGKCLRLLGMLQRCDLSKLLRQECSKYGITCIQSQVDVQSYLLKPSLKKQQRVQLTSSLILCLTYTYKHQATKDPSKQQSSHMIIFHKILEPMSSLQKVEILQQPTQITFSQCRLFSINKLIQQSYQLCGPQNWNHSPIDELQQRKIDFRQVQQATGKFMQPQQYKKAHPSRISIVQQEIKIKYTIRDYSRCVGVIRCSWYNRRGMLELVSFSTAFAISQWLVVTCGHSVFDKKRDRHCDKIQFIPSAGATRYSTKQDVYESRDQDFIRFQKLQKQQFYGIKPLKKDFAVFILKKPFKNKCYLQLSDEPMRKEQELQIMGYPCRDYKSSTSTVGTFFKRMDLRGYLNRVKEGYILEHNMDSQGGHSGSPILRIYNQKNEQSIKVVGIHTHKGCGLMNEGILMTKALKAKIQSFCQQLRAKHNIQQRQLRQDHKKVMKALCKNYDAKLQQQYQSGSVIR